MYNFRENYTCKYSQEIQSVHFGGSHQQATLHTGVLYTAADQWPVTFCSISPSRRHDPPAIWAHLSLVLDMVRERYPLINCLHVFSNGPATQYKKKGNFYLLSKEPFKKGFKDINWNFFEASHRKGAPSLIRHAQPWGSLLIIQLDLLHQDMTCTWFVVERYGESEGLKGPVYKI